MTEFLVRPRVVLDPIYGYVRIPPELEPILSHPEFQRLRGVSQTSLAHHVYPSLRGSRFEHALGVMHLAHVTWISLWRRDPYGFREPFKTALANACESLRFMNDEEFERKVGAAIAGAGMLHDIGHPPFSHVLERTFEVYADVFFNDNMYVKRQLIESKGKPFHEFAGDLIRGRIISSIKDAEVREILNAIVDPNTRPADGSWAGALLSLISGELDLDRLDYLMRDSYHAGTEYGAIDYVRLIDSTEIRVQNGTFQLGIGFRGRSAAEHLLVQRAQSYRWVYLHPRVVAIDSSLARCIEDLVSLAKLGSTEQGDLDVHRERLGKAFSALLPSFAYLWPDSTRSLIQLRNLTGFDISEEQPESTLFNNAFHEPVTSVEAAAVDDALVLNWIRQAQALGLFLYRSGKLKVGDIPVLDRFLSRARVVLSRDNVMALAWKSLDEYEEVAKQIVSRLRSAQVIESIFDDLLATIPADFELARDRFIGYRDQFFAIWRQEDRVPAFNALARELLTSPNAARLVAILDGDAPRPSKSARDGYWDVVFRDFAAIKDGPQAAQIFRGSGQQDLRSSSRMVQGLSDIAARDIKVIVSFTGKAYTESGLSMAPLPERDKLQSVFIESFVDFVPGRFEEVKARFLREIMRKVEDH